MKHILLALLLFSSANSYGAKRLSMKGVSYFPSFGLGSTSSVAYTGPSPGQSWVWRPTGGGATVLLRIITTSAAYIKESANPTATAADPVLPANTEMILEVLAGHKVSAAPVSASGTLYTSEILTFPGKD